MSDTIFALATAKGKAGVAVLRISGPLAFEAGSRFCGSLPKAKTQGVRLLRSQDGDAIDEALVLVFEKDRSFTGEKVVEFQVHGSQAVVSRILSELSGLEGLRLAAPGEFTRRALECGRLDLSQVEGLADLLEAETEAQRIQALRVMRGVLSEKTAVWRRDLVRAAALIVATIDFADEEIPEDVFAEVQTLVERVRDKLAVEEKGSKISERIREGFEVAIIGRPNAGKSTLLNALAGRDVAITSEHAGTTRDVIEVRMDLNGLPVTVLDTAGIRQTKDDVEEIGVQRALQRAKGADLRVFLTVSGQESLGVVPEPDDISVVAKADLNPTAEGFRVSGKTLEGVDQLVQKISDVLVQRSSGAATAMRERHRIAIQSAKTCLDVALVHLQSGPEFAEFSAEDLNRAIFNLDSLIGRVDVEQVLDDVFSSFCLGK